MATPISDTAILARFFMLQLKHYIVPTLPRDAIDVESIYPAVLLAHCRPLGLLPTMVSCLQSGLQEMFFQFCNV